LKDVQRFDSYARVEYRSLKIYVKRNSIASALKMSRYAYINALLALATVLRNILSPQEYKALCTLVCGCSE